MKPLHEKLNYRMPAARGFTLLEFIVYVALVGTMLVSATFFMYEFISTKAKAIAIEEVARNAHFALSRVASEISQASDLNAGSSSFGVNPGTLSLATAAGGTNPTVINVGGGALKIQQGAGSAVALTSSKVEVAEFTVENLSAAGRAKTIRVHLKLRYVNPSSVQIFSAETTFETTERIQKSDGFNL